MPPEGYFQDSEALALVRPADSGSEILQNV
jgi:hypothetical protein